MKGSKKKQVQVEMTKGQQISDKFRKQFNQMTATERESRFRGAMAIIYGGRIIYED